MVDPYFEILLKQWEDSEDEQSNDDDDEFGDSMDEWQAYVPDYD